jgi:RNA polymerase sigma-70 factor (ECF subfamily)
MAVATINDPVLAPGDGLPGTSSADSCAPEASQADADDLHGRFVAEAIPHMPHMYPAALRLTRNHHDAEDLLQDTFARAYLKFHQFAPGSSPRAWLYRILVTTFYTSCRQRGRRPAEVPAADLSDAPDCLGGLNHGWTSPPPRSAEAEAIDNLASSSVMNALAELPECFKTAVYLADVHDYRCWEIARITGVPLGTVMSRLHRGRQMLRAKVRARPGGHRGHARQAEGASSRPARVPASSQPVVPLVTARPQPHQPHQPCAKAA